ncbi:MAG: hypothetical protein PHW10_03500 [Candidatus Peribacteraceae bacterium]|nr:hypothetical protein [Candidatus Peribacteraceae bacterium]
MGLLQSILARFSTAETPEPVSPAETVQRQKLEIGSAVERLFSASDADLHSSVRGNCLYFASKLRNALRQEHPDLRLMRVDSGGMLMRHYHLRSSAEVIADPTWQQWLTGAIPQELPPVFVGTREDLITLVRSFAQSLPSRSPALEGHASLSPEAFVDLYYGFGSHAPSAEDVTFFLANAHRDPRSRVSNAPKEEPPRKVQE